MIRLTGAAFLVALVTALIPAQTAEADFLSKNILDQVTKTIEQALPLITKAQIESITLQLDKMDDASLYILKAAPDACAVKLVKIKCELGMTSVEIKPLVELTLDKRRAQDITKVAKDSAEMANNNFRISMASLGLSGLSFAVALFGAVIKKREYDAAKRKTDEERFNYDGK